MLAALNNLSTESVNKELVSVWGIVDEVDDSVVGDNVRGLFDGLVIILGNDRSSLVYK